MSFFMGLATGLAKSVDTQLKESIERTRDNIDMVSKWRLKKAEEREIARKKKDTEIETLIKDAAYVLSGNQNDSNAQNIAAALYKERGLAGFNDDINFIKAQKEKGTGVDPMTYITRAQTDLPIGPQYGLSDIVRSLSDAELSYADTDSLFPKGTLKGSGMIQALVPGFDAAAAGSKQAKDQMAQIGITPTPAASNLTFEKYVFDRKELRYATMGTNEKLTFLRDKIQNTSTTPEGVKDAQEKLTKLLTVSIELGDDTAAKEAIEIQLSRMEPTNPDGSENKEYAALIDRRIQINDKIALREAEVEGEYAVLAVQSTIAIREGDFERGVELAHKSAELNPEAKKDPTVMLAELQKLHNMRRSGPNSEAYIGSKAEEDALLRIASFKTLIAEDKGYTATELSTMRNSIYNNAKQKLAMANPVFAKLLEGLSGDLTPESQTKLIIAMKESNVGKDEFLQFITESVNEARAIAVKNGWNVSMYDDIALQLNTRLDKGFQIVEQGAGASAGTGDTGTGAAAGQGGGAEGAGTGAGTGTGTGTGTGAGTGAQADTAGETSTAPVKGDDVNDDGYTEAKVQERVAGYEGVGEDELLDMQAVYPVDDPVRFILAMKGDGDGNNKIIGDARGMYPNNPEFAEAVTKILSEEAADVSTKALDDVGYVTNTMMTPDQRVGAVSIVADTLGIPNDQAEYLIDRAMNRGVVGDARFDNEKFSEVKRALNRQNLTGFLGLGIPDARMPQAVQFIARRFNVSEDEARRLIAGAFAYEGDNAEPVVSPDDMMLSGPNMTTDSAGDTTPDPDFAAKFKRNTILGQLFPDAEEEVDYTSLTSAQLTDIITDETSDNDVVIAATQELANRNRVESPEDAADRDEATVDQSVQEPVEPDLIFNSMGRRIGYKKVGDDYFRVKADGTLASSPASPTRKSMLENPNRRGVKQTGGVEAVTDNAPPVEEDEKDARNLVIPSGNTDPSNRILGASNAALIAAYIKGNPTEAERNEIRRRLNTDKSFVDQLAAVVDRVAAKKKRENPPPLSADQIKTLRSRTSKQQVPMARGGLMRR